MKDYLSDLERVKSCRNRCIFCFIDQVPPGLRRALYVKDEDFRLSYLFGNFITMTGLNQAELNYIIDYKLSPLYISVHTFNPVLRCRMLRNPAAGHILDQLLFLKQHGVKFHLQFVIVPGYNDRTELQRSLRMLPLLRPALLSAGIVPVGITRYRELPILRLATSHEAKSIVLTVENFRKLHRAFYLQTADEFYVKSGL
ncbi:MAG: DUF512 domain-containing protein, partial [Candidatus Wallbacteria bacterium]|nr:DUF512 domain-containing protein [Candidatus Wallbacteria bacterium]